MSYDSWLEGPYDDESDEDYVHEMFQASPEYLDAFDRWMEDQRERGYND